MSAESPLKLVQVEPTPPAKPRCPYRADRLRGARAMMDPMPKMEEVAAMAGCSDSTVSDVLRGRAPHVSVTILANIADALGVPMVRLFEP